MPGRNAIKKKDLPKEREREGEKVFYLHFLCIPTRQIVVSKPERKGHISCHKEGTKRIFLLFFSKQTTLLPSLSVHFEMNMGVIFFRLL